MKHTEEEIVDALMVLYETCDALDCDDCPLRSREDEDDRCYLRIHDPSCYHIIDLTTNQPRYHIIDLTTNQPRRLFI